MAFIKHAEEALEAIRKLYKISEREEGRKFKSANKLRRGETDNSERLIRARAGVAAIRNSYAVKPDPNATYIMPDNTKYVGDVNTASLQGWCSRLDWKDPATQRSANCGELAVMAMAYLKTKKVPAIFVMPYKSNHSFCVAGIVREAKLGLPIQIAKNVQSLDSKTAICDPWANIACYPEDYAAEFIAKMQKWKDDGKKVRSGAAWIEPTNEAWIKGVLENPIAMHASSQGSVGKRESAGILNFLFG